MLDLAVWWGALTLIGLATGPLAARLFPPSFADRVRWISPPMGLFCGGEVYRFTSPADLLRFRPFSLAAKVRFAVVTLFLQRYPRREAFEEITASRWLRRTAGREVYDRVWGPLLRAKFGRNAESISMAWVWSKMRLRGTSRTRGGNRESLGYIEGGFGVVAGRLADRILASGGAVHAPEPVRRISVMADERGNLFEVETARRRERFAAVVSTVAPPLLARLAPDLPEPYRARCAQFEHSAILCTMLLLRRSLSPIYWMNISDPTIPFGGLIEHTNFISPACYRDRRIVYVSHYVYPDEPIYRWDSRQVFEHYRPGLQRVQPAFDDDWIDRRLAFRDDYAQPIVDVGYHRRLLPLESPLPGLVVATMAQIYPEDRGTNYAVRIGERAAETLLTGALARARGS